MARPQVFAASVDASGPISMFRDVLPNNLTPTLKTALGKVAYRLQEIMRQELDRLIYNTPISPSGYIRTGTLRRATYAARPGADHSRDHDAAFAGVDLGVTLPAAGGVVRMNAYAGEIEVGSWANYAWFVHEGYGNGHRVPKPFAVKAQDQAGQIVDEELGQALADSIRRTVM